MAFKDPVTPSKGIPISRALDNESLNEGKLIKPINRRAK